MLLQRELVYSDDPNLFDCTLVFASFGCNPLRIQSCHRAILKVREIQSSLPRMIVAEVAFDGKAPIGKICDSIGGYRYFQIQGGKENMDLFQKESIYNFVIPFVDTKYVIFSDLDLWSKDKKWILKIVKTLRESDENTIVHGLRRVDDTRDLKFGRFGIIWNFINNEGQIHPNPGLIWGMNSTLIKKYKFNPWLYSGGGDDVFVSEFFKRDIIQYQFNFTGFDSVIRTDIPKTNVKCIDSDIIHEYHGGVKERSYYWTRTISQYITMDIKSVLKIGEKGLLEWRYNNHPLRRIMKRCHEVETIKDLKMLIAKEYKEYDTFLQ